MKLLTLLLLVCLVPTLYGCPKKKDADGASEPVEGASSADKSGEASSDEMQEKKGGSTVDAPSTDAGTSDEKK
ncbi:MAG: hypothetical protein ACXVB9_12560 [Bdellovibrionota bacterium]